MKKAFCWILALTMLITIAACGTSAPEPSSPPEGSPPVTQPTYTGAEVTPETPPQETPDEGNTVPSADTATGARIVMGTQEYDGDNIAEIPYFEYDADTNPELDSLNSSLNQGVGQIYRDFIDSGDEGWIEIKSYPFTSEDYLQAVVTYITYPNYGTDGNMFSVNYDRVQGRVIPVQEAVKGLKLTDELIFENVIILLAADEPDWIVSGVDVAGFLYRQEPDGIVTQLLLEVTGGAEGAEEWKYFYSYTPVYKELYMLSNSCLFDPYDMDQMDPPLSYQRAE